jgi:hypothetical protein
MCILINTYALNMVYFIFKFMLVHICIYVYTFTQNTREALIALTAAKGVDKIHDSL